MGSIELEITKKFVQKIKHFKLVTVPLPDFLPVPVQEDSDDEMKGGDGDDGGDDGGGDHGDGDHGGNDGSGDGGGMVMVLTEG